MDISRIDYFRCPHKIGARACRSELFIEEVFSCFKSPGKTKIREGYLKCKVCKSRFPVFLGIPILLSDLSGYLKDNFQLIQILSNKHGGINKILNAEALLLASKAKTPKKNCKPGQATYRDVKESIKNPYPSDKAALASVFKNPYILNNYDDFKSLASPEEPLYGFLSRHQNNSPQSNLNDLLNTYALSKNLPAVLEVGCNVGGFLSYLSNKAKLVFGLDHDFAPLFFASCVLTHLPEKIDNYTFNVEADIKKKRPIKRGVIDNIEFLVGSGENLPFKTGALSLVTSCNLIDIVDDPVVLLNEMVRVLKNKGLLLSSDPYQFLGENKIKLGIRKGQTSWQRIKEILKPRIKILEERDHVPWIMQQYKRGYQIWYNHTFCGIKVGK